jgi:hypothetical protein
MEKEKALKLGKSILRESDLEVSVTYRGEVFTLRLPNPSQMAQIETEIARRLGGYPRDSFSVDHLTRIRMMVTIDLTLVAEKSPNWFSSAGQCYDEELLAKLYSEFIDSREQFLQRLKNGYYEGSGAGGTA